MNEKCFHCKQERLFDGEGRRANGSWSQDDWLPPVAKYRWFCCRECYNQTIIGYQRHIQQEAKFNFGVNPS